MNKHSTTLSMGVIVTSFFILLSGSAAYSDPLYDICMGQQTNGTNADWQRCGDEYLRRVDNKLNAVWKDVYKLLDSENEIEKAAKANLLNEQRSWIAYKDNACKYYLTNNWGRMGRTLHYYGCVGTIIEHRIDELNMIRLNTAH